MRFLGLLLLSPLFLLLVETAQKCDSETECGDGETCCKLEDDLWGCCPMPKAVCCDDHTHCCPAGTTCDSQGARCIREDGQHIQMKKKKPARKTVERNEFNEILCPDQSSKCPDQTTCCLLMQGNYGCCPVPDAVCCPDMIHCCPNGFTCHGQFCSHNLALIPHLRKFASTTIHRKPAFDFMTDDAEDDADDSSEHPAEDVDPISCGIGKTCPAKTTCCKVRGEDGQKKPMCCPLSNAVCCENTCCPGGYHCVEGGKCEKHAKKTRARFWSADVNDEEQEDI